MFAMFAQALDGGPQTPATKEWKGRWIDEGEVKSRCSADREDLKPALAITVVDMTGTVLTWTLTAATGAVVLLADIHFAVS